VTVFRDAQGVPHVRASSVTRLAFEQGRVTASDRAWQLEIERLRGEGRTAELLGPAGVEWDVFARRALVTEQAQRAFAGLDRETQAFVTAYADGVNAGFREGAGAPELDRLGATPGTWHPWTPLAVFLVQQILFGSFPSKLWRRRLLEVLGDDSLFRTEGLPGGSNALVVGPERTASGAALVGGDPHRTFEAPNIYQQVRLACPEFDVVGYTFPGVPGVQHFGHAGEVAWAITNAVADYEDVYVEMLERRGDEVWCVGPTGWERAEHTLGTIRVRDAEDVRVELVVTDRGPVVLGGPDDAEALSLRTPANVLGDLGFSALLPLLRARSADDVEQALDGWVLPVNNLVVADRSGEIRHRVVGRVPERPGRLRRTAGRPEDGDEWSGWVSDLPGTPLTRDAHFATANQRASAAYDRIGDDFAPAFRADRIDELLAGRTDLTAGHVAEVLGDARQNAGQVLLDVVADLTDLPDAAARVREELLAWDLTMAADSPGAALFAALRDVVVDRICAAEPLAPLAAGSPYGELFAPWFSLPTRVAVALHVILAADRPFGLDIPALVADALTEVASVRPAAWGERHLFHPLHALEQFGLQHERTAPATPLPGDSDAVLATGYLPGTSVCLRGPVARYVWDLADRAAGGWVVPLGASGLPDSRHHTDQNSTWAAGGVLPVVTDWDQLTQEAR